MIYWFISQFECREFQNGQQKKIDWQENDVPFILLLVYFINVLTARTTPFVSDCRDISVSEKVKENLSFEYRIYHICIPGKVCAKYIVHYIDGSNSYLLFVTVSINENEHQYFHSMHHSNLILDLTSTIMYPEINVRCFICCLNLESLHPHWIINNILPSFAPKLQ